MMSELFSPEVIIQQQQNLTFDIKYLLQVKSVASSAATTTNWTLAFIVTKFFQDMVSGVGGKRRKKNRFFKAEPYFIPEAGAFWIFGGCLAAIFIFCLLFVPETKGKSLEEIQLLFR